MHSLESHPDAGQVLVGIFAAVLIRINDRERGRCAFIFIGQMMVGDYYIEPVVAGPNKWIVRANSTIDAQHEFVSTTRRLLERRLLNAISFSETMRHVITRRCAQQAYRAKQPRCSGRAVNVVVAIDKNWFLILNRAFQSRDC